MQDQDRRLVFELGRPVRAVGDASGRVGHLVAVTLVEPYEGLVRWTPSEATFERLEELEEINPARRTGQ